MTPSKILHRDIESTLGNLAIGKAKCRHCRAEHDLEIDTYMGVFGNIMVGKHGGLIGNNIGDDGRVKNVSVWCRKAECLQAFIEATSSLEGVVLLP